VQIQQRFAGVYILDPPPPRGNIIWGKHEKEKRKRGKMLKKKKERGKMGS
jgi:hypothetical protein